MPQIAIIPSAAPHAPPPSAPTGGEGMNLFSPHLQNAIATTQPQKESKSIEAHNPSMTGEKRGDDAIGNNQPILFSPLQSETEESDAGPTPFDILSALTRSTDHGSQNHAVSTTVAQQPEQEQKSAEPNQLTQVSPSTETVDDTHDISALTLQSGQEGRKAAHNVVTVLSPSTEFDDNSGKSQHVSHTTELPVKAAGQPVVTEFTLPALSGVINASGASARPTANEILTSYSNIKTAAPSNRNPESRTYGVIPQEMRSTGQMSTNFFPERNSLNHEKVMPENNPVSRFQEVQMDPQAESQKPALGLFPSKMTGIAPRDEALLVRLNEIINDSRETRGVSITRSTPPIHATPAVSVAGQPAVDILAMATEDGFTVAPEQTEQQSHSLRQSVQEQFYQAKIHSDSLGENGTSDQNTDQKNNKESTPSPQTMTFNDKNSSSSAAEPVSHLVQTATPVHETTGQPSTETARQVILPSGTYVHEDNVVQQFMERFQIARRLAETRINIKLHPAELGELKIDLSVKEGSIKANVVAQSQQVQEIIERNIAKLRTVLEDQGYSLDAVTVTTESDSVGDFNLFEKQLFSQNDFAPSATRNSNQQNGGLNPESSYLDERASSNGVNVRI
jgi:hypothetical protein